MRLLVTRPEADGGAFNARLETLGHKLALEPLTRIEFCPAPLDFEGVQALIATSRNALRALQATTDLPRALALPIFVVGSATAIVAKDMGFADVTVGPGDGRGLADVISGAVAPKNGPLLYLAGDQIAFDIAGALTANGYAVRSALMYRSPAAEELTSETRTLLENGELDGVILMSPRASSIFVELVENANLGVAARDLVYFCLSAAVARPLAALAPPHLNVAREPNSEDMLRLIN